jgi:predicted  nucleic acid-binding Zn-ribbon protein
MPSIISCWCNKCDDFQEDGRSCTVCHTPLTILPLVDTMRNLEQCQTEHQENVKRVKLLRAEAAASREGIVSLGFEVEEYSKSVRAYHKGLTGAPTAIMTPSPSRQNGADERALRRFNRWSKRIARQKDELQKNDRKIRDQLAAADDTSRDVTNRLTLLRIRIRRIVQVFQTHFSGVAVEVLEALPRRICTEPSLECMFCTENLMGATVCDLPHCDHHMFHEACLVKWLARHNSCPVCRAKVQTAPTAELAL